VFDREKTRQGVVRWRSTDDSGATSAKVHQDRPFHDWTSHATDAFDGMARSVEMIVGAADFSQKLVYPSLGYG
jgi:hypothetical protein